MIHKISRIFEGFSISVIIPIVFGESVSIMSKIIEIKNLAFSYGQRRILEDVSFHVDQGEILALLGASGSGKTTLFRLIAGLEQAEKGYVDCTLPEVNGRRSITYLMQDDLLLPWRTVFDNLVLMGELGLLPGARSLWETQALDLLNEVGLSDWAQHYPASLSGGMKKRVALARALMSRRPLLLLDEPFQGLDLITAEQMASLLRKVKEKHNLSLLFITHDFHLALRLADRVLVLGDGKIAHSYSLPEDRDSSMWEQLRQNLQGASL